MMALVITLKPEIYMKSEVIFQFGPFMNYGLANNHHTTCCKHELLITHVANSLSGLTVMVKNPFHIAQKMLYMIGGNKDKYLDTLMMIYLSEKQARYIPSVARI